MEQSDTVILAPDYQKARAAAAAFTADLESRITADEIELPSLPDVVLRIRDALADEDVDLDRLAEVIGTDPALAARIMKIANSALFSRGNQPPSNLHAAIVRLGSRMVRNTAIALAAQQVFVGYSSASIRPEVQRIWRHSVHVGALSHPILTLRCTEIQPDDGFLAGLLHEIGALFILMRSKDHTDLWTDRDALNAVIDAWQGRIGAKIIEQWEFSDAMIEAVRDHASCDLAAGTPITLAQFVAVANYLGNASDESHDLESVIAVQPDFGALALDNESLRFALETAHEEVESLLSNLEEGGRKTQEYAASSA